jgi:hypothetical protein
MAWINGLELAPASVPPAGAAGEDRMTADRTDRVATAQARGPAPRNLFLFSGHMIDGPDRPVARFPAHAVPIAARAIATKLDELHAGPPDLAICGGACGGDLLFAEAALRRGARLALYLPLEEATFLASSVDFAAGDWRARFVQVKAQSVVHVLPQDWPALPAGEDPFEANNRRMLREAQACGAACLHVICLWNGAAGDGPGGTEHIMREVRRIGGAVHWLDTRSLWT